MTLAEATRQYQLALEYLRVHVNQGTDEDDDTTVLLEAGRAVEIAWLHAQAA